MARTKSIKKTITNENLRSTVAAKHIGAKSGKTKSGKSLKTTTTMRKLKPVLVVESKETPTEEEEEKVKKERRLIKGGGRRAVVSENNETDDIISAVGFRRMVKGILNHFSTHELITQYQMSYQAAGYPDGLHISGFKDGEAEDEDRTVNKPKRYPSRNFVVDPDPTLSQLRLGKQFLKVVQSSTQDHMLKVIDNTFNARLNSCNTKKQLDDLQNKRIRINTRQLQGELYKYWEQRDPYFNTLYRYISQYLGFDYQFPTRRVV